MKFHDAIVDDDYLHFYINESNINDRINVSTIRTIKISNWDQLNINLLKIIEAKSRKAYLDSSTSYIVYFDELYDILITL